MFTGVHVLSPQLVARLPPEGESDSIRQAYLPALTDGERIEGYLYGGYFHEHSTPARYLQGNWNALDLDGRAQLYIRPARSPAPTRARASMRPRSSARPTGSPPAPSSAGMPSSDRTL